MSQKRSDNIIISFREQIPLFRQKMTAADGFESDEEALRFGNRACGAACLKMVVHAFGHHHAPSVKAITDQGIDCQALRPGIGWVHDGLVRMAYTYGIYGLRLKIADAPHRLHELLSAGCLLICSVSHMFSPAKRGGHLIVVHGMEMEGDRILRVLFHDPSGWGQSNFVVSWEDFEKSWTGNIIAFSSQPITPR